MKDSSNCPHQFWMLIVGAGLLAALTAGCAGSGRSGGQAERVAERLAASPPPFLAGPAGVLLTNAFGFSARAVADVPGFSNEVRSVPGKLLGQGNYLVFTPNAGGVYFIWDVRENSGSVLNEALQGYAPITSPVLVTNVAIDPQKIGPVSEKVNGYSTKRTDVILALTDGSSAQFTVWRARELNGCPVRVRCASGRTRFDLNLSDIRLESLPREIFLPPDGFTKYTDGDTMLSELGARKATLRKKSAPATTDELTPAPNRGQRPSQYGP